MLDLVEQDQPLALLHAAGGTEDRLLAHDRGVEVGVDDDLPGVGSPSPSRVPVRPWWNRSSAVWVRARSPRACSAGVEGLGGPECLQRGGALDEGAVEVEGVGEVEVGLDVQGAGVVDVVLVDRDVAGVDVQVAVLGVRGRVRGSEVESFDGLGDEPVELGGADASGDRGHLGVHPPRGFGS